MKISVIIPTYSPREYLWECLDSLCGQSFFRWDFEILLILNGTREPYYSFIIEYIEKHPDVLITLYYTEIAGVSNARNIGIEHAIGEYITFIDDDDYVSSVFLEELYNKASHQVISLCYPIAFIDGNNTVIPYKKTKVFEKMSMKGVQPFYKGYAFFSGPCMKLIHRNIIGNKRYDLRFKLGEDSLFMFAISNKMKKIDFTSERAIYYRRFRVNSAMTLKRSRGKFFINSVRMIWVYTSLFFRGLPHYHLLFYFTRVLGAIKSIVCKF